MKKILLLLLFTIASYGQAVFDEGIQLKNNITDNSATKVNVQSTDGKVNTQTINTGFNKNIGLNTGDVVGANTLLNQYSTTPVDWTATTFASGQVVFYGGKQWIAKIATVAGDVPAVSSKWEEITFEALANKTVTVDQTIIDGSINAVSGNAVFDALATKAPISSVHNPVTMGTANGLSLSTQQLSLGLASSGVTGALSGTDWNTFNGKQNALTNPVIGTGTSGQVAFWNGTNTQTGDNGLFWDNTNKRLGIDTNIPSAKFTLGSVAQEEVSYGFITPTTNWGKISSYLSFKSQDPVDGNTNFSIKLWKGSFGTDFGQALTRFFIDGSNGDVGIDNSNPTEKLDVAGNIKASGTISASPATTANQVVVKSQLDAAASSGRYTPTGNVITGATSVSVQSHTYIKIGNIVTVYGESLPTPVVAGVPVIYEISLPIARANTVTKALGFGTLNVAGGSTNQPVRLESSSATTVRISFNIVAGGTPSVLYSLQYDITQ